LLSFIGLVQRWRIARPSQETQHAMVVCNCFNVRERDLAELASEGRCCLKSVRQATGLGTNCGKCIPQARAVLYAQTASPLLAHAALPAMIESHA
jgi:bacterioferritin-associated ferredoxin